MPNFLRGAACVLGLATTAATIAGPYAEASPMLKKRDGLGSALFTVAGASYDQSHPHNRRILHVNMVGDGNKAVGAAAATLPIRNAAAPGANGRASVAGPCGGVNAYNAAAAPDVPVGSKVQLSLQYAAGHESPQNAFTATFACGAPSENQLVKNAQNELGAAACTTITPAGAAYPVPAPTGRDAKVVECTLPQKAASELAGTGGQCTLSLQDQRQWGGCVDIKYVAANAGGTPGGGAGGGDNAGGGGGAGGTPGAGQIISATPPSAPLTTTKIEAVVTSAPANPNAVPPTYDCCEMSTGTLTVASAPNTGANPTVAVSGTVSGTCDPALGFSDINLQLTDTKLIAFSGSTQFKSLLLGGPRLDAGTQKVNVELSFAGVEKDAALTLTVLQNAAQNPTICDAVFTFRDEDATSQTGGVNTATSGPRGSLSSTAVTLLVIAILSVIVGIGAVMWLQNNGGSNSGRRGGAASKPSAGASKPPVAVALSSNSKPSNSGQLKPNWQEAKDPAGDTYYYNSATGETTWERHLVTV